MWKLHRYYCKEVLLSSVLTFVVLFGVVALSLVYRAVDRAQGGNLFDAVLITMLWTADTFPHLMAISLLFGTVGTFARAGADREITAIRAAGISPRVPMASALLIGMAFAVVAAIGQHYVIPWAHFHKYRVGAQALREFILTTRVAGDQFQLGKNDEGVMTWAREDEHRHFHDVVIFRKGEVFLADEAWFETEGEIVSLRMLGVHSPLPGVSIAEPTIRIDMRAIANLRDEGDKDLDSDQLLAEVYRGVHPNPKGARYTVHQRSCFALLPCLLAPIGFCIGVMARDRGRAVAMSFALVPLFLFYASDFLGMELTRTLDMPAVGWLPALVLAVAGIPFCWRLLRL